MTNTRIQSKSPVCLVTRPQKQWWSSATRAWTWIKTDKQRLMTGIQDGSACWGQRFLSSWSFQLRKTTLFLWGRLDLSPPWNESVHFFQIQNGVYCTNSFHVHHSRYLPSDTKEFSFHAVFLPKKNKYRIPVFGARRLKVFVQSPIRVTQRGKWSNETESIPIRQMSMPFDWFNPVSKWCYWAHSFNVWSGSFSH